MMKTTRTRNLLAAALACALVGASVLAQAAPSSSPKYSAKELAQRTLERRAVEAAIWGMPIVSVERTVNSVVYGIIGTALAQGALAGIGLALAGVPGALVLGLATFFLSVVPVGPPLIWAPAALWPFYQGETGWAIFIAIRMVARS